MRVHARGYGVKRVPAGAGLRTRGDHARGLARRARAGAGVRQQLLIEDDHHLLELGRAEQLRALDQMHGPRGRTRSGPSSGGGTCSPTARRAPARRGDPAEPRARRSTTRGAGRCSTAWCGRRAGAGIALMLNPAAASALPGTLLQLPDWAASPSGAPGCASSPGSYARSARRYSGRFVPARVENRPLPQVGEWSIWNEPNGRHFLAPQWRRIGGEVDSLVAGALPPPLRGAGAGAAPQPATATPASTSARPRPPGWRRGGAARLDGAGAVRSRADLRRLRAAALHGGGRPVARCDGYRRSTPTG